MPVRAATSANARRAYNRENEAEFVKDAFHDAVITGKNHEKLLQKKQGTKFSPVYFYDIKAKQSEKIYLRLIRRRWKEKGTTKHYSNEYNLHIPGMKTTKEFRDFLKEIGG